MEGRIQAVKKFREEVHWLQQPPYKNLVLADQIMSVDCFNPKDESPSDFFDRIQVFIDTFPLHEDIELYKPEIQAKFELSHDIMEFVLKEMFWTNRDEEAVLAHLRKRGIYMRTVTEVDTRVILHRAFLFYTDEMKTSYQLYGDALCIDYIKPVLKRRASNGQYFSMGLLTGQDENNLSVLFGLILFDEESISYHERIL